LLLGKYPQLRDSLTAEDHAMDLPTPARRPPLEEIFAELRKALQGLRFGAVELVVHDGRVVQIERREKLRLDRDSTAEGLPRRADRS
jgi:hypothetical protein